MFGKGILATALIASVVAFTHATPAAAGIPPGRYAIGDSVMLGARIQLVARGFRVNAEVSRQFRDAPALVRQLVADDHLPVDVIVHLGTNGLIDSADCDALIHVAGSQRRVFLVTIKVPRPYRDANNERLRNCAHRHDNATLVDWYAFSRFHTAWFYDDGYHLRPIGRREYAAFIDRSV